MEKKIELLEDCKRKYLGEGLGLCSREELQQMETQLEQSLSSIRGRKNQLLKEQIEQLKEKAKIITEENILLRQQRGVQAQQEQGSESGDVPCDNNSDDLEVETELFIGRPERGRKSSKLQL